MRDEIIKMSRESGIQLYALGKDFEKFMHHLERFFHMAQAAERDKLCAQLRQLHDVLALTSYPPTFKNKNEL